VSVTARLRALDPPIERFVRWTGVGARARAVELAVALAAAAATTGVMHVVVVAGDFNAPSPVARGLGPLWAALMILVAGAAYAVQRRTRDAARSRLGVALLAGAAVGVAMAPLMAGLHGTNQPPNTILAGDKEFHTEYVTRFSATWHLQDFTFRGLDAFYPPGWFWVAGRAAHVLDMTPWHIMKPFTILTIGAALLLAYVLWRMVLTPAGALAAAIGSSLVLAPQTGAVDLVTQAWYSPHSCFVAVTGAAWTAAALSTVRSGAGSKGRLAFLALVGTALALLYYLLFVLLVAVLAALAAASPAGRREAMLRVAAVCGGVAVLSAVFWVPLVGAVLSGNASQGHFVRADFLDVFVGVGGPAALSLLAIVAIGLLSLTISSTASQAVAGVLVGTVLYQLASVTSLVFTHNQLQPHRAVTMMWATFGAAVPVALEGFQRRGGVVELLPPPVRRAAVTTTLAVAGVAIFLLGAAQGADLAGGPYSRAAYVRPGLAQTAEMSRFIKDTTGKQPQQLTLLAGSHQLLITEPYYGFLPLRARYAHPEARLSERLDLLRAAAACPDAACTTKTLEESRFGPIDALILTRIPGGYRVRGQEDAFPEPVNVEIRFRRDSFTRGAWIWRDFGPSPYRVFVRRASAF
jgi:galactan 5-O-arabinofuranosyltransferase